MWQSIKKFVADEEGATAVEYGLIAALIAIAIITQVTNVGQRLEAIFSNIFTKLGGTSATP
ncbi:MAG: Flp family type IVb pilin [Bacteroidota bacterium]